jgi:hypothetical protein
MMDLFSAVRVAVTIAAIGGASSAIKEVRQASMVDEPSRPEQRPN